MIRTQRRISRLRPTGPDPAGAAGARPVRPPERAEPLPDHLLGDVVAALIDAGSPPAQALRHLGRVLLAAGDPRAQAWLRVADLMVSTAAPAPPEAHRHAPHRHAPHRHAPRRHTPHRHPPGPLVGAVADALLLAARSGLPPAAVVRGCAQAQRRSQAEWSARRTARLPVLLVLPLGLCLLPASVVLGIAPVVLGLLEQLRL